MIGTNALPVLRQHFGSDEKTMAWLKEHEKQLNDAHARISPTLKEILGMHQAKLRLLAQGVVPNKSAKKRSATVVHE